MCGGDQMSTESVTETVRLMREGINGMTYNQGWVEAESHLMQNYADKIWFRDDAQDCLNWNKHFHRVLMQHYDAGWDVREAFDVWDLHDELARSYANLVKIRFSVAMAAGRDPKPKVERVHKPGEMTESQKAGWLGLGVMWAVILGFVILLSVVGDDGSAASPYGTSMAKSAAILFGIVMTIYITWAGNYEKRHPGFAKARLAVGTAGAALLTTKGVKAVRGAQQRVHGHGDDGPG